MSLSFVHDGSAGDLVYSLPCVLGLCNKYQCKGRYCLRIDQPAVHAPGNIHPLGNVLRTREWAEKFLPLLRAKFLPLLRAQPWCEEAAIYTDQPIDVDLNAFRRMNLDLSKGDICQWLFWAFPQSYYDLAQPYLWVEPDTTYRDTIVCNRTCRYRNPRIGSWAFLNQYPHSVAFVGLGPEFRAFRQQVPKARHVQAENYLQLARIIAACKLYLGNQSVAYSLAAALGVRRCLEASLDCPSCVVHGPNGRSAVNQAGFEEIVKEMLI